MQQVLSWSCGNSVGQPSGVRRVGRVYKLVLMLKLWNIFVSLSLSLSFSLIFIREQNGYCLDSIVPLETTELVGPNKCRYQNTKSASSLSNRLILDPAKIVPNVQSIKLIRASGTGHSLIPSDEPMLVMNSINSIDLAQFSVTAVVMATGEILTMGQQQRCRRASSQQLKSPPRSACHCTVRREGVSLPLGSETCGSLTHLHTLGHGERAMSEIHCHVWKLYESLPARSKFST